MDNRTTIFFNALQLFASRGYDAVSVQEIAETAGITKPTLYYYYGSKNGLLDSILKEYYGRLFHRLTQAAAYHGNLCSTLTSLATAYFEFAKENYLFYRMQLAMYFAAPESESNQMVKNLNEIQQHLIEDLFIKAAKQHQCLKERHRCLAATFLGTINTYIGFALNGYTDLTENLAAETVHQFIFGIYTHPGDQDKN